MAVVFSDRVIEIAVIQQVSGRPAVNVWHMQTSNELWPASAEDVVQDFANNWQDHVLEVQTLNVSLVRFEWRSLDPSSGALGVLDPDPAKNLGGQVNGEPAPPNVAMLVNKRTSTRPRGARDGRMFLAGVNEEAVNGDGSIQGPSLATYQGHINSFYDGISDSGIFTNDERWPVVLETTPASRAPGSQSVTIDSRRVTSLPIDPLVSTQRDRLR